MTTCSAASIWNSKRKVRQSHRNRLHMKRPTWHRISKPVDRERSATMANWLPPAVWMRASKFSMWIECLQNRRRKKTIRVAVNNKGIRSFERYTTTRMKYHSWSSIRRNKYWHPAQETAPWNYLTFPRLRWKRPTKCLRWNIDLLVRSPHGQLSREIILQMSF